MHIVCHHCGAINRVPSSKQAVDATCGKCKQPVLGKAPLAVNGGELARHLAKNDMPVVVDFWAPWCGPCVQFAPTFAQAAALYHGKMVFLKVDTQDQQMAASEHNIRSIPTLAIFHQGKEQKRLSGALPPGQFAQWLNT